MSMITQHRITQSITQQREGLEDLAAGSLP